MGQLARLKTAERLKGARVFAAVDQQVLAGDEAGLGAAQIGAVLAELGGGAVPARAIEAIRIARISS